MNASDVTFALDQALPDSKIVSDLRTLFQEISEGDFAVIQVDTVWTPVPIEASFQIVKKQFIKDDTGSSTDMNYRVTVAIGDFQSSDIGWHEAGYCFAKLVYSDKGVLVTQDFRREYVQFPVGWKPYSSIQLP